MSFESTNAKTALLLGAGASVDAGVPASVSMTEELVRRISAARYSHHAQALNFVCGAIIAHDTAEGRSPYEGLDVERVFAAVRLLAERRDLEVTPFVANWHPAVNAWDRNSVPSFFDKHLAEGLLERRSFNSPQKLITRLIESVTGEGSGAAYGRLAEAMVHELRALVATTPKQTAYLAPLAHAAQTPGGLTVATLNYDLSVEQVAGLENVPVSTGITNWIQHRQWRWPAEGIRLLKLHGSIDWAWHRVKVERGNMPYETVQEVEDPQTSGGRPVLVFGQRGKLQEKGPFLSLLAEWEQLVSQADHLIVVGYSFRDAHVNEVIRHWTIDDPARTITLIDPGLPEQFHGRPGADFRSALVESLNPESWKEDPPPPRVRLLRLKAGQGLSQTLA